VDDGYENVHSQEAYQAQTAIISVKQDLSSMIGEVRGSVDFIQDEVGDLTSMADQLQNRSNEISESANRMSTGVDTQTNDLLLVSQKVAMTKSADVMNQELNSQTQKIIKTIDSYEKIVENLGGMTAEVEQIMKVIKTIDESKSSIANRIASVDAVSQENLMSTEEIAAATQDNKSTVYDMNDKVSQLDELASQVHQQIDHFNI